MALTKAGIVELANLHLGFPKTQCFDTTEILLEIIKQTLASGDDVMISGFGKFCVKQKKKRKGRDPASGEDLMLEPRTVVTFKCSGKLRDRINR